MRCFFRARGAHSSIRILISAARETQPCFLDCGNGKFAADARIRFQKLIQRVAPFQIVNQDFERNAGSAEDRFSAKNIRVLDDYIFRDSGHGGPPARIPIISSIHQYCSEKCKSTGMKLTLNPHPPPPRPPPLARNLRPPRRQSRLHLCPWYRRAHEFRSAPLILAHATPFCTRSHSSVMCLFTKTRLTCATSTKGENAE